VAAICAHARNANVNSNDFSITVYASIPFNDSSRKYSTSVDCMKKVIGDHAAIVVLGEVSGLRIAGAPWWAIFVLCAAWFTVAFARAVFPQDSAHRLAWWRDRRNRRDRR
jgi:hypothetical protein